jgi:hypothetical protein
MNLARICVALLSKSSTVLAFSMIWFKSSDFHQVHQSNCQMQLFEICNTDEKFSCMSADTCEIDTQVMIVWLILIKFFVHHFLIFIKFTTFKSDFHQVHHSNCQMQLFEILLTDEKFFLYVNQFIKNRHSSLILDIIESSASTESDQIRLNQIKSSMSSSLSDILRETITLRFVRRNFNQIIVIIAEISFRQMSRMRFNWTHFDEMIAFLLIIEHKSRKLNQFYEIELLKYLKQRLHAYLNEMCWFVWDEFEISVNNSIVNKALKRLNWNRKKMMRQTAQRNQQLRNDWMQRLNEWIAEQLIFLNESAACKRTNDRRYDWVSSDIAFTMSQNLRKSKRWSILSAFIVNDYITWEIRQNSIIVIIFNDFMRNQMLSQCTSTIYENLRWVFCLRICLI